ncbi:hypothetical protein [Sphingomonas sp. G-3-2-10]|uniref:hypothetical protein n=1 Tax=Sphingomonas sp. G-3-2-10 TaxID=2728838 RepID=UPI00146DB3D6|nr:hypothetical protein [Sphingomonas sp. G-3-2-10]NML04514.1 hypothetical protein [Sphingomonas sp. G-3-2-10]
MTALALGAVLCAGLSANDAKAQRRQAAGPIDVAKIKVPALTFVETDKIAADYDKYFFFHRDETDFTTAYADVLECDGYSRGPFQGSNNAPGYVDTPYQYQGTMAGALGGALGNLLVASISTASRTNGERRRLRRANMRTCMGFKGYQRYGLPKGIWGKFHFEGSAADALPLARQRDYLQRQAKVASGPRPAGKELEP